MRTHSEKVRVPDFRVGELVLVHRPFYERGSGAILPQCDGPYLIARLSSAHTCVLEDALSGEPYMSGKLVSVNRLVRFAFPADWAPVSSQTTSVLETMKSLVVDDIVAVQPRSSQFGRVYLGKVIAAYPLHNQIEVSLMHVPPDARFGPWQRRKWDIQSDDHGPKTEIITANELITAVQLVNGALTNESLEKLTVAGVNVGAQPHRDGSLPPRRRDG